LIFYGVL